MKSARPALRQIVLFGIGILIGGVLADVATAANPGTPGPTLTVSSSSGEQVRPKGKNTAASVITPAAATGPASQETIDHGRWNHGGDANANDVALFRRVIAAGTDDNDTAFASGCLLALLFGGLALGQYQGRKAKAKTRRQPYLPA